MARTYDNTNRARRAAGTRERIAASTEALLATMPVADVTLDAIAAGAGVTVQTVLRHMGSRDGCFEAAAQRVLERVARQRGHTPPGDVGAAIAELMAHYEAEGRLILHLLAQAERDARAASWTAQGRAFHRAWVERTLIDGAVADEPTADALVAATDLYVWKLLRLDLGRSPDATRHVVTSLVRSALEAACPPS